MKVYSTVPCGVPDTVEIENKDQIKSTLAALKALDSPAEIKTLIWNKRSAPSRALNFSVTLPGLEHVIIGHRTKEIGAFAFFHCYKLQTAILPEGLEKIGVQAFAYSGLVEIRLPESIAVIRRAAFHCCKSLAVISIHPGAQITLLPEYFADRTAITGFTCPKSLVVIGDRAFCGCGSLETVVLNEGLQRICDMAFFDTAITRLHLPSTLQPHAPLIIQSLQEITVAPGATHLFSVDSFLTDDAGHLIAYPPSKLTNGVLHIPEFVRGIHAFAAVQIQEVEELHLPTSFTDIHVDGTYLAYITTQNLKAITVSPGNPFFSTEDGVLYNKDKTELVLFPAKHEGEHFSVPASVKMIDRDAFTDASLKTLFFMGDVFLLDCALHGLQLDRCVFFGDVTILPPYCPAPFALFKELEFCRSLHGHFGATMTTAEIVYAPPGEMPAVRQAFEKVYEQPRAFIET